MKTSEKIMRMAGVFIAVSVLICLYPARGYCKRPAALSVEKTIQQAPAAKVLPKPAVNFTDISVNFLKSDIVIAYQSPASIRLICEFSDSGPAPAAGHDVAYYINSNKVFSKDAVHLNGNRYIVVQDVTMPPKGNYTFKCVVDDNNLTSKTLPFTISAVFYETCRPTVKVHMVGDSHTLQSDLGIVSSFNHQTFELNVTAPDQILSLTNSSIVPPGNEVTCSYGSALWYKKDCRQAKKVLNQHKYECLP
ncbi:MAG: hypothetical protein KKB30_14400 [Proteobacteria bacterium]|nr:hypothetical protein [Pseudomonadota bacterium]MBU1715583.1 hypothetical protein [Pseudomonadota bacterium]